MGFDAPTFLYCLYIFVFQNLSSIYTFTGELNCFSEFQIYDEIFEKYFKANNCLPKHVAEDSQIQNAHKLVNIIFCL